MTPERPPLPVIIAAAVAIAFFLIPIAGLIARAPWATAVEELTRPEALAALRVSFVVSVASTILAVFFGVPLAWLYARVAFPGRDVVRALTTLPMILPPVVGGVALLFAFGRAGLIGPVLDGLFGIRLPFTTLAAVLAAFFVSAPFLVLTVEAGLRSMDRRFEEAYRGIRTALYFSTRGGGHKVIQITSPNKADGKSILDEGVTPTEIVTAQSAGEDSDVGDDDTTGVSNSREVPPEPRPLSPDDPVLRKAIELLKAPAKKAA